MCFTYWKQLIPSCFSTSIISSGDIMSHVHEILIEDLDKNRLLWLMASPSKMSLPGEPWGISTNQSGGRRKNKFFRCVVGSHHVEESCRTQKINKPDNHFVKNQKAISLQHLDQWPSAYGAVFWADVPFNTIQREYGTWKHFRMHPMQEDTLQQPEHLHPSMGT